MFNWGVTTNWPILRDMAVGLTILTPGNATDAMWLPTTDTLFVVATGLAEFSILTAPAEQEPKTSYKQTKLMYPGDMVFVPRSVMFVFRCLADVNLQMVSFYNRPDPKRPVTLSSFSLYSYPFRQATLFQYDGQRNETPIFVDARPAERLLQHSFPVLKDVVQTH
jgi:oxalate decarboxylase/phosphoglucose isomerase-like protein (cupin superfamily)